MSGDGVEGAHRAQSILVIARRTAARALYVRSNAAFPDAVADGFAVFSRIAGVALVVSAGAEHQRRANKRHY